MDIQLSPHIQNIYKPLLLWKPSQTMSTQIQNKNDPKNFLKKTVIAYVSQMRLVFWNLVFLQNLPKCVTINIVFINNYLHI